MAEINILLEPFMVPNFARLKLPVEKSDSAPLDIPGVPLSVLSPETLEEMCDHFRDAVFKKAGKKRPAQIMPG